MSLALLYLRVFHVQNTARNLIYGLIGFICLQGWVFFFLVAFQCLPVVANWDPSVKGRCLNMLPAFIAFGVVTVCIDLTLIVIVIPRIIRLRLQKAQKIALLIIANLGWVSLAATILRTVKLYQILHLQDFLWYILDFLSWTGLELSTAMICASAPVIRPLLRKFTILDRFMATLDKDETRPTEDGTWRVQSETGKGIRVNGVGYPSTVSDGVSEERLMEPSEKLEAHVVVHQSEEDERSEMESGAIALRTLNQERL
jgi:hypothetical protein